MGGLGVATQPLEVVFQETGPALVLMAPDASGTFVAAPNKLFVTPFLTSFPP